MLDWARALAPLSVAQLLLTASDVQDRERYVNAKNALEASLKLGAVPIINENDSVATSEIKLGDNDTLSAWAAYLVNADALIILTDVDGLYDADPRTNPAARRLEVVEECERGRSSGGQGGLEPGYGRDGHQAAGGEDCHGSGDRDAHHRRGWGGFGGASAWRGQRYALSCARSPPGPQSVVGAAAAEQRTCHSGRGRGAGLKKRAEACCRVELPMFQVRSSSATRSLSSMTVYLLQEG